MLEASVSPLRRRMIEDMTIRNLAPRTTQQGYIQDLCRVPRPLPRHGQLRGNEWRSRKSRGPSPPRVSGGEAAIAVAAGCRDGNPFCPESCVGVAQKAIDRPRSCTKVAPKLHIRCIGRLLTCLPMIHSEHRPIDSARARLYGAARAARPSSGRCRSHDEGLLDTLEERASHSQATQAWASNRSGRPQSGGCIPPRRLPLTGSERVRPGTWCDITRQIRSARASVHPLDTTRQSSGREGRRPRTRTVRSGERRPCGVVQCCMSPVLRPPLPPKRPSLRPRPRPSPRSGSMSGSSSRPRRRSGGPLLRPCPTKTSSDRLERPPGRTGTGTSPSSGRRRRTRSRPTCGPSSARRTSCPAKIAPPTRPSSPSWRRPAPPRTRSSGST